MFYKCSYCLLKDDMLTGMLFIDITASFAFEMLFDFKCFFLWCLMHYV